MLVFGSDLKIYLCVNATDMRKSFQTLSVIVTDSMQLDPLNGAMYVFWNKAKDKLKILQWENRGFWLHYRRLSQGRFHVPSVSGDKFELDSRAINRLLEGIDLSNVRSLDLGNSSKMF